MVAVGATVTEEETLMMSPNETRHGMGDISACIYATSIVDVVEEA